MEPSVGRLEDTWIKALVIDTGADVFAFVTVDAIGISTCFIHTLILGAETAMRLLAYDKLVGMGITAIPIDNFMVHGAHTHSGWSLFVVSV